MSSFETQAEFFKALSHPSRLLILGLCRQRSRHTEELAGLLQLSKATVSHHLSLLTGAGLLESEREGYYQNYRLKPQLLEQTLQQIIASGLEGFTQSSDPFRSKTLRDFFKHGRLQQIPVQRKKRVVILEKIAQSFEPDRDYPEHQVNQIITEFYDDYATLRRELIDMGLMTRAANVYRRVAV